jgi:hypothetical protein
MAQANLIVVSERYRKHYSFEALLTHYPIGKPPAQILPTKVVKAIEIDDQVTGWNKGEVHEHAASTQD